MRTIKNKSRIPLIAFATGQVWKMANSNLHIGTIGKTLVHYKHLKLTAKRAPNSLCSKTALEHYLIENKALLVPA